MAGPASPGDTAPTFARRPVFGADVDSAALTRDRALAMVFLRHPGSAVTRFTALALHEVWPELDLAGVGLVAIVEGDLAAVRDFVPRYHLKYPVIADDGSLHAAFGVRRDTMFRRTLLAFRPNQVRTYLACLQAGRGLVHGPVDRLMAALVVAPGGRVAWRWDARSLLDPLDVGELGSRALAAGAPRGPG